MNLTKPSSIRLKMGVVSAVVLGAILIVYSLYHYYQLQEVLYSNFDTELAVKAHELGKTIKAFQETKSPGGDIQYAALKVLRFDVEKHDQEPVTLADRQWFRLIDRYDLNKDYISILSLEGRELASSANMPKDLREPLDKLFEKHRRIRSTWDRISKNGTKLRVLQMMMFARDEPHYLIQIATPMTAVDEILQKRLWGIVLSIPIVMVFFSLTGFFLANHILRPVRKITKTAENLTHEDLSQRVEVTRVDSEMFFLVNAFNKMIERLESSFEHLTTISSHIAHELKTPLTIIRGEGQAVLSRPQASGEKYREVIQSSIMETERMLQVIEDLLIITNISYNREIFDFRPISLTPFLEDIYQKSRILADPENITVTLQPPETEIVFSGDPVHLRRLLFNLIDNAIKYSPSGSRVSLSTRFKDNALFISVQDNGVGLAAEDIPAIFDHPFRKQQNPPQKDKNHAGTGIGLYLCRAIAEAHHGKIIVDSKPGEGSTFSLFIPVNRKN